jgi:hypothetical protein
MERENIHKIRAINDARRKEKDARTKYPLPFRKLLEPREKYCSRWVTQKDGLWYYQRAAFYLDYRYQSKHGLNIYRLRNLAHLVLEEEMVPGTLISMLIGQYPIPNISLGALQELNGKTYLVRNGVITEEFCNILRNSK